jgi:hypothetical protein
MTQEPACIVEVIEIVPPEDVPVVAARVAERLAMPVERVQKLIDARVGPITRPLRPDKAEAIAQTFEAAGVIVAIRPATEDDEIYETAPAPRSAAAVDEPQVDHDAPRGRDGWGDGDDQPDPTTSPDPEHDEHDDHDDHDDDHDVEDADDDTYAEAADDDGWAEDEADVVGALAREVSVVSVHMPRLRRDPDEPADLPGDEPDPEPAQAPGHDPDPEPADTPGEREPMEEPPSEHEALSPPFPARTPAAALGRFAAAPRAPASLRIEPEDDEEDDGPDMEGLEARGEIQPRRRSLVVELGEAGDDAARPAAGPLAPSGVSAAAEARPSADDPRLFTDDASWAVGDDPSEAWTVPRRSLAGGAGAEATRTEPLDLGEPEPMVVDDDQERGREPADAGDGSEIGRAGRRSPEGGGAGPMEGVSDRAIEEPAYRHGIGRDEHADDDAWDGLDDLDHMDDQADDEDAAATPRPRGVPIAWRGLGSERSGPARPVDANIPRRLDAEEERAELEAQRTTMRRTLMLWALVIAVVLLVVTQFWASGRAATGYDQGLHRFRDGQFAAARQVWSQLASTGDANAQFMLGYMSEVGMGQAWSARAAASWYRLAADQGHAEAQWRLGSLYDRGLGVPWSPSEARRWWAAAAEGGHAEAAFTLGRSVFTAARTTTDLASAGAAFERALALGWPDAAAYHHLLSNVSDGPNESALR